MMSVERDKEDAYSQGSFYQLPFCLTYLSVTVEPTCYSFKGRDRVTIKIIPGKDYGGSSHR